MKMQTQIQHMSKKNKITVPFYSPPSRLYGQTPSEIIKEARAAVMSPPAIGIKPVFTSRPFTPKEKERTLFGNMKKTNSRPPSSFSIRNPESQESGSRVKLPSIEIVPRRKSYSTTHYSSNLSLDNLTEDCDAEAFEEIKCINDEKLPTWKKYHSSPSERKMIKVASCDGLNLSFTDDDAQSHKSNKFHKLSKSNSYSKKEILEPYQELDSSRLSTSESSVEVLQTESSKNKSEDSIHNQENVHQILEIKSTSDTSEKNTTVLSEISTKISNEGDKPETNAKNQILTEDKLVVKSSNEENLISEQSKISEDNNSILGDQVVTVTVKQEEDKNPRKNGNVAEKAVVTESKSQYLLSLKKGYKSPFTITQPETVPLEILELYETARYYGVGLDDGSPRISAKGSTEKEEKKKSFKNVEDYFGEKPNDYLNQLKDNFSKVDEKIKTLSESYDEVNRKLNSRGESTTKNQEPSSENTQFVMNNKKRYHVVGEKGDTKEKAYKKWTDKQEENIPSAREQLSNDSWDLFWKNSYFKNKEEDDSQDEEKNKRDAAMKKLNNLVSRIAGLVKIGADNKDICETTSELYSIIKKNKITPDGKLKEDILKALYLYVDNENPEVLLNLARLLLYLKDDKSLSVACKVIFKVARIDKNDSLFLNVEDILELFLEGIGRASPLDCAESCIYSYGALKFLTMNHNILSRILHMGALDLMTLHLKMINAAHTENGSVGEQTQHALFQLTGTLRHVAAGEGALPLFLTTNCISILCSTLRLFYKDEDVIVNISRTLSLLSTDESVIQVLMSVENILSVIIDIIERYKENDKILIRLSFCLGNVVEHSDLARVQLSRNDASLSILLNVLKLYIDKDLQLSLKEDKIQKNSNELSSEVVDDIIVKVIRIIANMSMNPIVGSNLSPASNEKKSLMLSKLLSVLLMRKDPGITLLATLGCLNNISYYCNPHSVLIDITQGVERVLGLQSQECQAEAARVLGNLTRHKEIRDLIYNTQGVNLLIKLLSSQDQEVVRCACGALVNMMLDADTRKCFIKAQGIDKLVQILELYSGDWFLASLAIRVIWNSCADDLSSAVLHNNVEHLLNILTNSLAEENWNDGDMAWEEFASIATDLLEKISAHLESTS